MTFDYAGRIARLQAELKTQKAALAILAGTDQMRYLTGWREGGHERFVGLFVPARGEAAFLVPAMNSRQAETNGAGIGTVLGWKDETGWKAQAQSLLTGYSIETGDIVLVDDELHSVHLLGLQELAPGVAFQPAGPLMKNLRQIKNEDELAALETAAKLIDTIFEETVVFLREGMTELEVADFVHAACKRYNTGMSFAPLICFGANGAHPHHHTGLSRLKRGDMVIIDIGCLWDHYASDITRTIAFGEPSDPDAKKVYGIVSAAHWATRNAAKPGANGETVDAAARNEIAAAGYGDYFVHRTGHGIGLSTHEPPNMVAGDLTPLEPGMCFSVEPGIYLPDRFGVRIENIVTVTADGVRSLNAEASRELRVIPAGNP